LSTDAPVEDSAQGEWAFDIVDVIEFLRFGDFRFGTGEVLRVVALLERLRAEGREPRTAEDLAPWLAPLLCASGRQQDMLRERLAAYASPVPAGRPQPKPAPPPPKLKSETPIGWVGLLIAAVMAGLIWIASVAGGEGGDAFDPTWLVGDSWARLSSCLTIPLVPLAWWLVVVRRRRGRRAVLQRRPFDGRASTRIATAGSHHIAFTSEGLSRDFQGWRTHRKIESRQIDAAASVKATVAACGRTLLVRRWRPTLPAYPIVVEAASSRDHVADLARALSRRLLAENVEHSLYFSGADPRWVRGEDGVPTTLSDLAARYRQDVLVFLGDGETVRDASHGGWRDNLGLEEWRTVVLLTPVPRARWSWRERRLAETGMLVLPATGEGIAMLGDFLRAEGRRLAPALDRLAATPGPLAATGRNSPELHGDVPPSPERLEALLDAIALEISPDAFELVCVLAAFPELRPDLTSFAAERLTSAAGGPLANDSDLAAVAALPWFRTGRMPDWLRIALARSLRPGRAEEARSLFAAWLSTGAAGGEGIEITSESLGPAVAEAASADPRSTMRDALFLRFANRQELGQLDLEAPERVLQEVRPESRRFELRGWWTAAFLGVLFAGAWGVSGVSVPIPFFEAFAVTYVAGSAFINMLLAIVVLRRVAGTAFQTTPPISIPFAQIFAVLLTVEAAAAAAVMSEPSLLAPELGVWLVLCGPPFGVGLIPFMFGMDGMPVSPSRRSWSRPFLAILDALPILLIGVVAISPLAPVALLLLPLLIVPAVIAIAGGRTVPALAAVLGGFFASVLPPLVGWIFLIDASGDFPARFLSACALLGALFGGTLFVGIQQRRDVRPLALVLFIGSLVALANEQLQISSSGPIVELLVPLSLLALAEWQRQGVWRSPATWVILVVAGALAFLTQAGLSLVLPSNLSGSVIAAMAAGWVIPGMHQAILIGTRRRWTERSSGIPSAREAMEYFRERERTLPAWRRAFDRIEPWLARLDEDARQRRTEAGGFLRAIARAAAEPWKEKPLPSPPPPPRKPEPPQPQQALADLITNDDYPAAAIRAGEQGTTAYRLTIGVDGRVSDCTITSSSGSTSLDAATVALLSRRARYTPARDSMGNPTIGVTNGRIVWSLPDDDDDDEAEEEGEGLKTTGSAEAPEVPGNRPEELGERPGDPWNDPDGPEQAEQ